MVNKVLVLILVMFQFSVAQNAEKPWRANEKLKWSDFRGTPDINHPFSATTATGLSYGISADIIGDQVDVEYTIKSYFLPKKSWVRRDVIGDQNLLAHEQLHFDITELYVRKLRKKLSTIRFTINFEKEIEAIYDPIAKSRVSEQKLYDAETNHSKNRLKQKEWEIKIALALDKLKEYASK